MKINYLLSIVYLLLSFLMIKKSNKKLSITLEIIYSIALLFCYNVVVVYFLSCFHIDGSLFIYSIINYVVGSILLIFNMKRKNIQRYSFHKKELIVVLCIIIVLFLISYFRFRGFTVISYESSDSGIHYRQALYFSKELTLLNHDNSKDLVYSDFNRVMPISYINGGFTLKVFSQNKPYYVFLGYDVFCLIIGALLFFCTISRLLDMKSKYYFYSFIITLFYILAYPLNSFLFGFCYLGLGIIVINLSYLTILKIANDWQSNWIFNLILLFIIHFSLFFSYYLFVPCIYLGLGLYYIYLWKTKKMNFKKLLLYGGITLVIPFIIGFTYFILPSFGLKEQANVLNTINLKGYSYENIAPIYLFVCCLYIMSYLSIF